jgi:hypothetical protein
LQIQNQTNEDIPTIGTMLPMINTLIHEKLKTTKPKPKTTESKPKTTESKPKTTESKPKTIEPKPKTIEPKPKTIKPKPKTIKLNNTNSLTQSKPNSNGNIDKPELKDTEPLIELDSSESIMEKENKNSPTYGKQIIETIYCKPIAHESTYQITTNNNKKELWKKAILKEYASLKKNHTWDLVRPPERKNMLIKWISRWKSEEIRLTYKPNCEE